MSLGSDFAGVETLDADLTFREGTVPERLAYLEDIARALVSPRGSLDYDREWGLGLAKYIGGSGINAAVIQSEVYSTIMAHECTRDASVSVVQSANGDDVTIECVCYSSEGTYPLTVGISSVRAEVRSGSTVIARVS